MSDFFTLRTLLKVAALIILIGAAYVAYGWSMFVGSLYGAASKQRVRAQRISYACLALAFVVAIAGCAPAIQPVRYQPVTVVTTKPCLAGKPLPPPATVRTQPACEKGRVDCLVDAAADIEDLKREADASRRLLKECSR